jgi:hypothetical protein
VSASIYKPLTGKRRGLASFSQLWLAPDHILLVRSSRLTERYQRFALADIQSLVITATPDRTVLQILAVITALAWGALAVTVAVTFWKWVFIATGAVGVLLAILDIARGPRCRCTLYTAVSQEPLPPVSRQRIAARFLAALRPAVEAVQGALPAERAEQIPMSSPGFLAGPPRLGRASHRAAWILFSLLLLDSVLMWTGFRYSVSGGEGLILTAYFAEILLALMVLIQDRDHPLHFAYLLAAAVLVCVGADAYATVPEIGRRTFLAATGAPLGPMFVFPFRVLAFALAWRLTGGLIGLGVLFFTRPGKTIEVAVESASPQETAPE